MAVTAGSGTTISTDDRTIAATSVQVQRVDTIGSTTIASGQVTPTTTAGTLLAARDTRERVVFTNNGNVDVWVGPATVTTANGFLIPAGYTLETRTTALVQAIIASGTMTGVVSYWEEYS